MRRLAISGHRLLLPLMIFGALPAFAAAEANDEIDELRLLLAVQQEQIEALQQAVRSQQATLEAQHKLLAAVQARPALPSPPQQPDVTDQPGEPDQPVVLAQADEKTDPPEAAETTEAEAAESVVEASAPRTTAVVSGQDEEKAVDDAPERTGAAKENVSFAGSWPLPDTDARLRIGGFVKLAIIENLDPLLTEDRFIVGGIPAKGELLPGAEEDVTLSVAQSRLNLELRDKSPLGDLRAFIEGDFNGTGDTFRLRHAFGQFRSALAGKTWSTLMDLDASPEEVDFEGINGRINVRQAQLRFFPELTDSLNLSISAEDPNPDVTGGTGVSRIPDIVVGVDSFGFQKGFLDRFNRRPGWSARLALLLRNISARETNLGKKQSTVGWGIVASGEIAMPYWSENDKLIWQLTYGDGVGRYINDLGTIGGQDGIFSPSGNLKTWPVFAGYASYQHWWRPKWRSNLTFSWVKVDAYDFQSTPSYIDAFGLPYERTLRASLNLLYNPITRVELGAELLWGERKNANNTRGDANQIQVSAKYVF